MPQRGVMDGHESRPRRKGLQVLIGEFAASDAPAGASWISDRVPQDRSGAYHLGLLGPSRRPFGRKIVSQAAQQACYFC